MIIAGRAFWLELPKAHALAWLTATFVFALMPRSAFCALDQAQVDWAVLVTSTRERPIGVHAVSWNFVARIELTRPPHLCPLVNRFSDAEGTGKASSELSAIAGVVVAALHHAICCIWRFTLLFGDITRRIASFFQEVGNGIVTVSEDLLRIGEGASQLKHTNIVQRFLHVQALTANFGANVRNGC